MIDIAKDLDLHEQVIRITRRTKDFSQLQSKEGEFARTFTGPATRKNQAALQNYGVVGVTSGFDPHQGIAASWSFDGQQKFTGRLEVNKVKYKDGEPHTFHFTFYGRQRSLASVFGGARFSDLDWSEYDHVMDAGNVALSWQNFLFAGDLHYPLIDTSKDYYFGPAGQNVPGNIANANNAIVTRLLRPAIRAQTLLKKLFSKFGLVLEGGVVDSAESFLHQAYLLINRHSGESVDPLIVDANFVNVTAGQTAFITEAPGEARVEYATTVQDDLGQYSAGVYTALQTGQHKLSGLVNIQQFGAGSDIGRYTVEFKVNGVSVHTITQLTGPSHSPIVMGVTFYELELSINAGDTVEIFVGRGIRTFVGIDYTGRDCRAISANLFIQGPLSSYGVTVSVNDQMTDDPIVPWLSELIKSWNLVLVPDNRDMKKWLLISSEGWKQQGQLRDWGGYIDLANFDYDKPNVFRKITMKYQDSDSAVNSAFKAQAGRNYGELNLDTGVEFGEESMEVTNPCTIIPPALFRVVDAQGQPTLDYVDITMHKSLNMEGKPVKEKYILYYNNGTLNTAWPYYMQTSADIPPATEQFNFYPNIGSTRDVISTPESESLSYAIEAPLLGTASSKTRYFELWQRQIRVQFAPASRVLSGARFLIPSIQFLNYNLNDEIFVEGQYWRILEISHDQDGREALISLISSRLGEPLVRPQISAGGKASGNFDSEIAKSEAGVNKRGADYFAGFAKSRITPNVMGYMEVQIAITSGVIQEVEAFGGRLRKYIDGDAI